MQCIIDYSIFSPQLDFDYLHSTSVESEIFGRSLHDEKKISDSSFLGVI